MNYTSTRDSALCTGASTAILTGIAPGGGLFVPQQFPQVDMREFYGLTYPQTAQKVLGMFLTDYDPDFLKTATEQTYSTENFGGKAGFAAHVAGNTYALELWHGPTCAFKDYALQLMPRLLVEAKKNLGETGVTKILVATSGDTGKAALAGYAGLPGIRIAVFYPNAGTSEVQRLQMATQEGDNVAVYAVNGNFDDAQTGVKRVFADEDLAQELAAKNEKLSSANSINWGRLVPQIVYYFYSYAQLAERGDIAPGAPVSFCVPTGNFGDILAGYYAKRMGLPVEKLICASNDNKVLYDFFKTGVYDKNRPFILTSSPSMDILISSNLERLIYTIAGQDAQKDAELMTQLKEKGVYEITAEMKEGLKDFVGGFATEEEVKETIHDTYQKTGYVMDTHTAVAAHVCAQYRKDTQDEKKCLVASTASPYKFVRNVMTAIDPKYDEMEDFALIDELEKVSGFPIPNAIKEIRDAEVRHTTECDADQMKETVKNILGV